MFRQLHGDAEEHVWEGKVFSHGFCEYLHSWRINSLRLKAEVGLFEGFSSMTCYFLFSCLWAQNALQALHSSLQCWCFFFKVSNERFLWPPLLWVFFLFRASFNAVVFNNAILKLLILTYEEEKTKTDVLLSAAATCVARMGSVQV